MRNVVSVWVLEGTITSLQVAFQEERSARHSGRQGPCPGIRKAATLWPRPPDMQEPGPPTEVPAHSHKIKGQVRPALKPAANKLWVSWVHF